MADHLLALLFGLPSMIIQAVVYVSVWLVMTGQVRLPRSPWRAYAAHRRRKMWERKGHTP